MVTPNKFRAMKTFLKYISLAVFSVLAIACVERFNPEERVVNTLDLERCMKPVQVKTQILYNKVTVDVKVFQDAEKYIFEVYSSEFEEGTEPDPSTLIESFEISPKDMPFTFATLEDVTLYYRISAINDKEGKTQSYWTSGHFTTNVDPATICLTLNPEIQECFEKIRFDWVKSETDKYLIEVYTKSIPSEGEPSAADLYKTIELTNDDVPYTEKFPAMDGNYYFRAKAIDIAGERRDSKWAKGSFKSEVFNWPTSDKAINEPFTDNYSEPDRSILQSLFTGASYTSVDTVCYKKIYYMKDCLYSTDKMSTRGAAGKYTTDYGVELPVDKRFIFFYINQPGQFKAILRKSDGGKGTVALLTNKKGEGKKAIYLFDSEDLPTSKGNPTVIDITEDELYGITEPAQVYIFNSQKTKSLVLYPITWTPWTPAE